MSERKKRKKRKKLWTVLALAISLITVQTMQVAAEAAETPSITAGNLAEFGMALDQVEDGGTIGITSIITIDSFMGQMGVEDKHIRVIRMNADAGFEIVQGGNVTMCNMSFDGNSSEVTAVRPMFLVSGSLTLDRVTIQNCSNTGTGGAVYVETNGNFTTLEAVFDSNRAEQGGHIYSAGTLNLNNARLVNGVAAADGGAIKSCAGAGLMLTNCVLRGNSAVSYGGAVSNSGNMNMSHSIAFGNSAEFGADIANDRSATYSDGYEITELEDLFTAEGVTALGWEFDCTDISSPTVSGFDTSNPDSLKKMDYEIQGTGGSGESEGGDNPGGDNGSDNPGGDDNPDDNGDNTGDDNNNPNEDGSGDGGNESGGGTVSGNDAQGDGAGNGNGTGSGTNSTDGSTDKQDGGTAQSGISPNSGTSGGTNTAPSVTSREDNSTTTTTNNYYTYESPSEKDSTAGKNKTTGQGIVASEASGQGTSHQNASTAAVKESGTAETANAGENPESPSGMQIPDNISLNLVDVDIVYDMTDGISNIEISNARERTDFPTAETVSVKALSPFPAAADAEEDSAINWYEIIKMALLAAILLIVIPKPEPKRRSKKKRKKKAAIKASENG